VDRTKKKVGGKGKQVNGKQQTVTGKKQKRRPQAIGQKMVNLRTKHNEI